MVAVKTQQKNLYELTYITKPNLKEDNKQKIIDQIESSIKNFGGDISNVSEPDFRRFAHKIKGFKEGEYITVLFTSPPDAPNILKRTLLINDDVLRFVVVKKESK